MEVRKYPAPAPPNPAVEALVKTMADPNWQTKMDLVEFEKTIAWLGGLSRWFSSQPATSRRSIFKKSKIFHFERGQSVFRQGDPPDYFYILISGQVDIHILSIDPHTHKNTSKFMSSIFPGDHFGDSSIIAKCPRTASCIAMQHTLCLGLSREYFVKTFQVSNEEIEWWKANVVGVDELPYSDLNRFAKSSTLQKFNLGTSFAIGGLKHLMFIRSGRAELGVRHPDIGIKTLGELKVGDCFGEAGMFNLNQSSWVVTATGEGPLMVLAVPHEMMWEFPSLHDRLKRLAVARQNYLEDKSIKQPIILQRSVSGLVLQRSANGKLTVAANAMLDPPVVLPNTASKVKILPEDPFPVVSLCRQPSHRTPAPRTPRPAFQLSPAAVAPSPAPTEMPKGLPSETSIASVKNGSSLRERSVPDPDSWGKGSTASFPSFRISRTSSTRTHNPRERRLSQEYPRISNSDGVNLPDLATVMKTVVHREQRSCGDMPSKGLEPETSSPQVHGSSASIYAHSEDNGGVMKPIPAADMDIVRVNTSPVFPRLQYKGKHARTGQPSFAKTRSTRSMVIHLDALSNTSQSIPNEITSSLCEHPNARPRSKGGLSVEKYREAFSITVNDLHPTKFMQISKKHSQRPSASGSRHNQRTPPKEKQRRRSSRKTTYQSISISDRGTCVEETLRNSVYIHPRLPSPGSMTHLQSMSGLLVTKNSSKALLVTSNRGVPSSEMPLIRFGERVLHPGLA